ncbi:glycosyltransferase family 4 protein [Knoellia sp. CPCC 206435]|uniref:glycosyltransferase family 4 protein n=1 Tax=Knoellia terrae TaxID=3404797 RepID=UPI003B432DE7
MLLIFGFRPVLERTWGPANVWWYRHWHGIFLYHTLRRRLADTGQCTVYAQCPVSALAALRARSGPHQRVVMAVHFRVSQADEWADKGQIRRGGGAFRAIRRTEQDVLSRVDGLVFVSHWGRAAVSEWLPSVGRVPSRVMHNFVNVPPFEPAAAPEADLVCVGNLEAVKNHRFVLRVVAAAARAGHTYTVDIFGEGREGPRLLAMAEELGVRSQVRLRGFCSDVQQRLPRYRACVHASYSESLPLAVIEAMAAGLPVICSTAGGLPELLDDPTEGRFWPLDDVEAAAEIVIDLLENPQEMQRCGRAAWERCRRDYDAQVIAPSLLSFLLGSRAER